MSKILFILKARTNPYEWETVEKPVPQFSETDNNKIPVFSSGLYNSALQIVRMLQSSGQEAEIIQVVDNNDIDREVTKYKPTHVILEALWVVPEKFEVLRQLHPTVDWIVRLHSEIPFIANEGIAMQWIHQYLDQDRVYVGVNSDVMYADLNRFCDSYQRGKILYLPNYYPIEKSFNHSPFDQSTGVLNVGCFGAIRPMKNQLAQACAAIGLSDELGVNLKLHINAGRIETAGGNVLKNLRALFSELDSSKYELVEHGWYPHYDFLKLISTMDLGLQVSFSETFNIVTADFVNEDVPVVVSHEIDWIPCWYRANPNSIESMIKVSLRALRLDDFGLTKFNKRSLKNYSKESKKIWTNTFRGVD